MLLHLGQHCRCRRQSCRSLRELLLRRAEQVLRYSRRIEAHSSPDWPARGLLSTEAAPQTLAKAWPRLEGIASGLRRANSEQRELRSVDRAPLRGLHSARPSTRLAPE